MRRPYRTKFRPWRDSQEEQDIHWYIVPDDAPLLDYPSRVYSLDWSPDPWAAEGVGEVYGADRKFDGWERITLQPAGEVHGTEEDFTVGGIRDSSAPQLAREPNGLPTECVGPPDGIVLSGEHSAELPDGGAQVSGGEQGNVTQDNITPCGGFPFDLDKWYLYVRSFPTLPSPGGYWHPLTPGTYRLYWFWANTQTATYDGFAQCLQGCPFMGGAITSPMNTRKGSVDIVVTAPSNLIYLGGGINFQLFTVRAAWMLTRIS